MLQMFFRDFLHQLLKDKLQTQNIKIARIDSGFKKCNGNSEKLKASQYSSENNLGI